MKTDTQTLAKAMEILARDIESGDGVANAAIAEAAERLYSLDADLKEAERQLAVNHERAEGIISARQAALERVSNALADALSTFRKDGGTTIITAERQEAWWDALNS
jgi:hypothetical protein